VRPKCASNSGAAGDCEAYLPTRRTLGANLKQCTQLNSRTALPCPMWPEAQRTERWSRTRDCDHDAHRGFSLSRLPSGALHQQENATSSFHPLRMTSLPRAGPRTTRQSPCLKPHPSHDGRNAGSERPPISSPACKRRATDPPGTGEPQTVYQVSFVPDISGQMLLPSAPT